MSKILFLSGFMQKPDILEYATNIDFDYVDYLNLSESELEETLKRNDTKYDLAIGWSLGAQLLVKYQQHINCEKLLLLTPPFTFAKTNHNPYGIDSTLIDNFKNELASNPKELLKKFCFLVAQKDPQQKQLFKLLLELNINSSDYDAKKLQYWLDFLNNFNIKYYLSKIKTKEIQVILGLHDQLVNIKQKNLFADCCQNTKIVIFNNTSHCPIISAREELDNIIREIVKEMKPQIKVAREFDIAASYYDAHALIQRRIASDLIKKINPHLKQESKKILDLGCGTGFIGNNLNIKNHDFHQIDLSSKMCDIARQNSDVTTILGDIEHLPYPADSFDIIVSSLALHWVENLKRSFKEIKRVLKKDGKYLLTIPSSKSFQQIDRINSHLSKDLKVNNLLTEEELSEILNKAGLRRHKIDILKYKQEYNSIFEMLRSFKKIGTTLINKNSEYLGKKNYKILKELNITNPELRTLSWEIFYIYR